MTYPLGDGPGHPNGTGDTGPARTLLDAGPPSTVSGVDLVVEGLRALGNDRSAAEVSRLITTSALASMPGAAAAGLSIRVKGRFRTVAQTSELPLAVDTLQYERGAGPCLDAARNPPAGSDVGVDAVVYVEDLRTDDRWPAFAQAALEQTPALGMLCYRLVIDHRNDPIGLLSLYATKPHAFDPDTIAAGQRLATYAGVVLAYATEREKTANLEQALHSSRDIGAAIGILMCRHLITREQAFDLLAKASQNTHRKLRDLAADVIDTGDLTTTSLTTLMRVRPDVPE